jgi:hypothetical protein
LLVVRSSRRQLTTNNEQLTHGNLNKLRLFIAEGQEVSTQAELDWITEGCAANDLDGRTVAEAHLEQSAAKLGIAANGDNASAAADAQTVQRASLRRTAVITTA